jgi:NADPH:quinone reductase-like Zn-dependent oxidoreductase
MQKMKATVFHGPNDIRIEEVPRPNAGAGEAVIRITLTTICGTDLHILRGEYPVKPGLVIGHEPVGVIEELGEGLSGYEIGDRVLVGAIGHIEGCENYAEIERKQTPQVAMLSAVIGENNGSISNLNFGSEELAFLNRVEDFFGKNWKRGILKLRIIHIPRDDLVILSHSLNHHLFN